MVEEIIPEQVVVYEAVNDTLKEFFVGISTLPLTADEIASRHRESPPPAIAHWRAEHQVWYRCVDPGLAAADSQDFVRGYAQRMAQPDWKALAG